MDTRATTPRDDRRDLRVFGLLMAGLVALCFGVLVPWVWGLGWPLWPWLVGAAFAVAALAAPQALGPVQRLWLRLGHGLGWLNTRLILGLVFVLVFVPVGLAMRLFRDPLARRADPAAASYRRPSRQPRREHLDRPF